MLTNNLPGQNTDRVYKKAFSVDVAYRMILGGERGAFSDELMECFLRCRPKLLAIIHKYNESADA